jgi:hypothetical protein
MTIGPTTLDWRALGFLQDEAQGAGPRTKRLMQVLKNPGVATFATLGLEAAPTTSGTFANADTADSPFAIHVTTASINTVAEMWSAFTILRRDWEVEYVTRVYTHTTILDVRHWAGLFSANPSLINNPTGIHCAGFRYDTDLDGTAFWRTVTSAASASPTVTTTTQAIATDSLYDLRLVCSNAGADIRFFINGAQVSTHTVTLPTASQLMGFGQSITNLGAAAKRLRWSRTAVLHN